jgi:hypothetical protein
VREEAFTAADAEMSLCICGGEGFRLACLRFIMHYAFEEVRR